MTRRVLIHAAPENEIRDDLAMALDRLDQAIAGSRGDPDQPRRGYAVWSAADLRIHHDDDRCALLVGSDAVARQHLRDRNSRGRLPADEDMRSGWTFADHVRDQEANELSPFRTCGTIRAWLSRTRDVVACAIERTVMERDDPLDVFSRLIAPVATSILNVEADQPWLVDLTTSDGAVVVSGIANGLRRRLAVIGRDLLPTELALDEDPVTMTIKTRSLTIRPWRRVVRSSAVSKDDPVAIARVLRDPTTTAAAEHLLSLGTKP